MSNEGIWERPPLYPKQLAAIFNPARIVVIEASTKSGKTIGCLIWLIEQALVSGRPGRQYWWVAPTMVQARMAYSRARALRGNGIPIGIRRDSAPSIELPNGARVVFRTAEHPDALYGEDVFATVLDEATRMREEAWHAVYSTLTKTRGAARIIGNVKGRRNWAYLLARRAQAGEPDMHYARITAYDAVDAGVLDARVIEAAQSLLPEDVFKELYLAEPSDDAGNPFGLAAIRACIAPLSTKPPRVWGWDLGKSIDSTVGIALDEDGAVCGFERFRDSWESTERRLRAVVGSTRALVDDTGVGDPVVERLHRIASNIDGFTFTSKSKQQLMEGLQVAIQSREVHFPAGTIVDELETFEYESTRTSVLYSAPPGLHDDCVIALALAVQHARQRGEVRIRWIG